MVKIRCIPTSLLLLAACSQLTSCSTIAFSLLALRTQPVFDTFPESKTYSKSNGQILYNSWDSTGKLYQDIVQGADADSFRLFVERGNFVFGRDKNSIFYKGKLVPGALPRSFSRINFNYTDRSLGPDSKVYQTFFSDNVHIWFEQDSELVEIPGANLKNFELINAHWARTHTTMYVHLRPTPEVDIASVQVIYGPFAKDRNGIWYFGNLLNAADPESFEVLRGSSTFLLSKDRNHVYLGPKVLEGADPETFAVTGENTAEDKAYIFHFGPLSRKSK